MVERSQAKSRQHNRIVLNIVISLDSQLRGKGYEVFACEMRVPGPSGDHYPDIVVACGRPQFKDAELNTLLNPGLVVEVLSKATEDYDRGAKFAEYRAFSSLSEYLVVAQDRGHIEHWVRETYRWVLTETDDPAKTLELPSIGCTLALSDVYDRVFS